MAVKLGQNGTLGPAIVEGYIPRGFRSNEYVEKNAAQRAIEMLMKRLAGQNPPTEIPLRGFEMVAARGAGPRPEERDDRHRHGRRHGAPGQPRQAEAGLRRRVRHVLHQGPAELPAGDFKGIHGGYDSTWVDEDPDRVVPLDALRQFEKEGRFKLLLEEYYALCGIGTNVAMSKKLGAQIAEQLKRKEVSAAIYTST